MCFCIVFYYIHSIMFCFDEQRMLERAKVRREKLDTQLSSVGHDVRRSPLKDANVLLAQVAGNFSCFSFCRV